MDPLEYHKNLLKNLQAELIVINKQKKKVTDAIKEKIKEIDFLEEPLKNQSSYIIQCKGRKSLLIRDIDLCMDYMREHGKVPSKHLVDYLNQQLVDQEVRWPIKRGNKEIDAASFMNNMGKELKEHHAIGYYQDFYPETKRKTTFWYLK